MTDFWDQLALTELIKSIVIIGIEDKGDTKVKDKESKDIQCETLASKIYLECNIPEELWGK